MIAPPGRWLMIVALTCCLPMLLSHLGSMAINTAPRFPGKGASMDELLQFYNEAQQYLNSLNRPRFGKRSSSWTHCRDPSSNVECYA